MDHYRSLFHHVTKVLSQAATLPRLFPRRGGLSHALPGDEAKAIVFHARPQGDDSGDVSGVWSKWDEVLKKGWNI